MGKLDSQMLLKQCRCVKDHNGFRNFTQNGEHLWATQKEPESRPNRGPANPRTLFGVRQEGDWIGDWHWAGQQTTVLQDISRHRLV